MLGLRKNIVTFRKGGGSGPPPTIYKIGYDTIAPLDYSTNSMLGCGGVAPADGNSINWFGYIAADSAPINFIGIAYKVVGTDLIKVGETAPQSVASNALAWLNFSIAAPIINGETYIIAIIADGNYKMRYDLTGGYSSFESFTFLYSGGAPASISAAQRADSGEPFSFYITFS